MSKLLFIALIVQFSMLYCVNIYYTSPFTRDIISYNFSTSERIVVAPNQPAISNITNNSNKLFWVSYNKLMTSTKGTWTDITVFATLSLSFGTNVAGLFATETYVYWTIKNKIYSKKISGGDPIVLVESNNPNTITSVGAFDLYNIILFVNGTSSLYVLELDTKQLHVVDYSSKFTEKLSSILIYGDAFTLIGTSNFGYSYYLFVIQDVYSIRGSGFINGRNIYFANNGTDISYYGIDSNCAYSLKSLNYCDKSIPTFGGAAFDTM